MDIKALEQDIKNNLKSIKCKKNLKKIYEIIKLLRKKMDKYDGLLTNIKDGLKRVATTIFNNHYKSHIINDLFDIVEGYDFYSSEDKQYTLDELQKVANIHDRTFWEKVVSILRAS